MFWVLSHFELCKNYFFLFFSFFFYSFVKFHVFHNLSFWVFSHLESYNLGFKFASHILVFMIYFVITLFFELHFYRRLHKSIVIKKRFLIRTFMKFLLNFNCFPFYDNKNENIRKGMSEFIQIQYRFILWKFLQVWIMIGKYIFLLLFFTVNIFWISMNKNNNTETCFPTNQYTDWQTDQQKIRLNLE